MKVWHGIVGVLCLFLLIFLVNEFEIFGVKFWGVRKENARREVFEQTQSYVESKRIDLSRYHHEWMQAKTPEDKISIEAVIRQQFSNFDEDQIKEPDLKSFLHEVMLK
jgi:hypothetical protein